MLNAWQWAHIRNLQADELVAIVDWLEDIIDRINIQLAIHQSIGRALRHVLNERWDMGRTKGDWMGGVVLPGGGGILYGIELYVPSDDGRYDSIHVILRENLGGYSVEKLLYDPKSYQ